MSVLCRNGHQSDDPDYCSVCGVAIAPGSAVGPASGSPTDPNVCPECGTPRSDLAARYCEVCRHDFQTGASASVGATPPVTAPPAPPPPIAAAPTPPPPVAPVPPVSPVASPTLVSQPTPLATGVPSGGNLPLARWEVLVAVDSTLDEDPDPQLPCPTDQPDQVFPLDLAETLIGRRDDGRDIRPQIPVRDPAVSRRHAHLLRLPDGTIAVRDLASTNGTKVNGSEIPPGVTYVLAQSDVITLGRWTKLTLRQTPEGTTP